MKNKQIRAYKLVYLSFLIALATTLHIVENFLPSLSFIVPGAKLGLANLVTLVAILAYGWKCGFIVAVVRSCLGSFLSGTFLTTTFFLSFSGAVLSSLAMGWLNKWGKEKFSPMGISIVGAVVHNVSQLTVAGLIIQNGGIFFYLPYLLIFALPTGYFTGILAYLLTRYLTANNFLKYNQQEK
ncbi:MAG TPA: Gx transporter family protein [Clostridia bacterium]|jgi:heptaprenyl diphosphate synthase|nr:Gx transporter family protein [Clostridia bacterium]